MLGEGFRVLIACEESQTLTKYFREAGIICFSCDLKPGKINADWHYKGSVFDIINFGWDLMIAHPPCTYLTVTANKWLKDQPKRESGKLVGEERRKAREEAIQFFMDLYNAPIPRIAIENPIMHKYAKSIIRENQKQVVQPWMFGHTESKATCLWLKNLPPLVETNNVKEQFLKLPKKEAQRLHYASPGPDRWKIRSTTFQGIADAMAEQWGRLAQ